MTYTKHTTIPLGAYVFKRLEQLGIGSVFGVPGDYNLKLLDFIQPAGLHWVGNCNELNAAYSADGYSRIHGLGVVITTFGVGELSAINGIAGAYAERAPVIHIVGAPSRSLQSSRALVHHTFIDGEYRRFAAMHAHVTAAQTSLTDAQSAPDKIDWVIEQAMIYQRPVYLQIPEDMVQVPVSTMNLSTRPIIRPSEVRSEINMDTIDQILTRLYSATQPLILVDGESRSMGALDEIDQLITTTGWPTWTTAFGKGLINEELPNVRGVYMANYGDEDSSTYFKTSDLVLFLGPHLSNINTHIFTAIPEESSTVAFSPDHIKIAGTVVRDISPRHLLQRLLEKLEPSRLVKANGPTIPAQPRSDPSPSDTLSQDLFYPYMNPMFRRGDVVLTETGTAAEGGKVFQLPKDCRFFTAVTWLSIGYMLPATLGAALAQRDGHRQGEPPSRTILFIGDGSLQMTAQELSIIIKENLNVIVIVINNNGYTIERAIHGRKASYNDIAQWNYKHALGLFGLNQEQSASRYFPARTWGDLRKALDSKILRESDGLKLIEVFMDQEDCTGELKDLLTEQISRESGSS